MNGCTGRWVGIDVAKNKLDVALLYVRIPCHRGQRSRLMAGSIPP
jgi:hypothetical protein